MYPTVQQVIDLPAFRAGRPAVRAGRSALGTRVRWLHVSELRDPAGTLSGGELVLSIGTPAADPATDATAYVTALHRAGAAGLVIELGQLLQSLPGPLVQAARSLNLPLVELQRSVRFVELTELVHAQILHEQYARMRLVQEVNETFWALTVHEAGTDRILDAASTFLGMPVVLEDLAHRALAFAGAQPVEALLHDWMARSRRSPTAASPRGSGNGGPEGWTTAPVGPRGRRWGRLVVPHRITGDDDAEVIVAVLGQAADAITVLRARDDASPALARDAQRTLLQDLLQAPASDDAALRARSRALGLAVDAAFSVVVLVPGAADDREIQEAAADAIRNVRVPALCGSLRDGRVAVVMSRPETGDDGRLVARLVRELPADRLLAVAAASPAGSFAALADALGEAVHVADVAAAADDPGTHRPWRRADLGARGLLWDLRDDPRLLGFVDEQLAPILRLHPPERDVLLRTLRAYVGTGGVMTDFARRIGTSRPAAYDRLAKLTRTLGRDPAVPAHRLSLHLAVLALDDHENGGPPAG